MPHAFLFVDAFEDSGDKGSETSEEKVYLHGQHGMEENVLQRCLD
jgi:hypothetical protein